MIDPDDEITTTTADDLALANLTEAISRRLESGDPVNGVDLGDDPESAGSMRRLVPALLTMVSLGEQVAREESARKRQQRKIKAASPFSLEKDPESEEVGP